MARGSNETGNRDSIDRTRLPLPEPEFRGTIGRTYLDSKSEWPSVLSKTR